MSTSGGSTSSSSANSSNIRTNVSVTNINCTNTISSMPSTMLTSPSSDALNVTTSSISSTNDNDNASKPVIQNDINSSTTNKIINSLSNNITNDVASPSIVAQSSQLNNNHNSFYGNGSIRIAVPKMEESDESETELTQIEHTAAAAAVSMRTSINKNTPRPMSWEGELSENDDQMEIDASNSSTMKSAAPLNDNLAPNVISYATNGNNEKNHATHHTVATTSATTSTTVPNNNSNKLTELIVKDEIKPEFNEYALGSGNDTNQSNLLFPNKRYPLDMSNVKFEASLQQQTSSNVQFPQNQQQSDVNSPLLVRSKTTLLPTNPSPDSAIHSVYTHSSPSQSPLTSRHTPYTPSLSRNNSDASYSSCYSYSSEFSPTHSPIQGRHNMYASGNFNGSPLHHSVLYKPMVDGNDNAKLQHQQSNEENVQETEIIPSAGISRQQLINR